MDQYANSFSPDLGRCYRFVYELGTTRPMRCPGPIQTRGWWQDAAGRFWLVDACTKHADPVRPSRPLGAKMGSLAAAHSSRAEPRRGPHPEASSRAA